MTQIPQGHSPLGGSSMHRVLHCAGSVWASTGHVDEESDHAAVGTAAHALAEACLLTTQEPWMWIDQPMTETVTVDKKMADAVSVYVDYIRKQFGYRPGANNAWVEHKFHCPTVHPLFYGSTDFAHVDPDKRELTIIDYKHGAGIIVEAKDNPQAKYYAIGMLESLGLWHAIDTVRIIIVQPNGFHYAGPIREWTISTDDLDLWLLQVLVPAMQKTEVSRDTVSGEHCRFCPARFHNCPALMADMKEYGDMLEKIEGSKKGVEELTNDQVERLLELEERSKIVIKAAKLTAFNRLQAGGSFVKWKLGKAKVNREWKTGAEAELVGAYGKDAYEPQKIKSPAQIEALPLGEAFAARWAFKPEAGLALIKADDARPAVNRDTKSLFTPVKKGKKAA